MAVKGNRAAKNKRIVHQFYNSRCTKLCILAGPLESSSSPPPLSFSCPEEEFGFLEGDLIQEGIYGVVSWQDCGGDTLCTV